MSKQRKFPCEFLGKTTGKRTIAIGLKLARSDAMDVPLVDEMFVDAQLQVTLALDPIAKGDAAGQGKLVDTESVSFKGTCECHGVMVKRGEITVRLSFPRDDVDAAALEQLAYVTGTITAKRTGDATSKDEQAEAA